MYYQLFYVETEINKGASAKVKMMIARSSLVRQKEGAQREEEEEA